MNKDKIKRFWDEHKNYIMGCTVFGIGCIVGIKYSEFSTGYYIMDHCMNDRTIEHITKDGTKYIMAFSHGKT